MLLPLPRRARFALRTARWENPETLSLPVRPALKPLCRSGRAPPGRLHVGNSRPATEASLPLTIGETPRMRGRTCPESYRDMSRILSGWEHESVGDRVLCLRRTSKLPSRRCDCPACAPGKLFGGLMRSRHERGEGRRACCLQHEYSPGCPTTFRRTASQSTTGEPSDHRRRVDRRRRGHGRF